MSDKRKRCRSAKSNYIRRLVKRHLFEMEFEAANVTDQSSNLVTVETPLHWCTESTIENYYENSSDDCANKETYMLLPNDHHKQGCDEFGVRHEDNFLTTSKLCFK